MDGIKYGSFVSKIENDLVSYTFKGFTINVKHPSEFPPNMYEDQKGYIHFKTKDFHVWHKIVFNSDKALEYLNFLITCFKWDFLNNQT